jgi:hypothetical protein
MIELLEFAADQHLEHQPSHRIERRFSSQIKQSGAQRLETSGAQRLETLVQLAKLYDTAPTTHRIKPLDRQPTPPFLRPICGNQNDRNTPK